MAKRVRTMRDVWDRTAQVQRIPTDVTRGEHALPPEVQRALHKYCVRREAWKELKPKMAAIFNTYRQRLGDAGFLDIER